MGLTAARKYINELRKKQSNPYLWPDYLTGLPDKAAIIKKIEEVFPKLGEYSILYIRIANIQPYLLKYGPDRHAEVVQWAAAALKTSSDDCRKGFVGTLNTHDFIGICRSEHAAMMFARARETFRKKAITYYSKDDVEKGIIISFDRNDGKKVRCGLMKLKAVILDKKLRIKKHEIIRNMARICDSVEPAEDELAIMSNDMILRD
jgi:GGDEF domain-containing protein